jgi:uncharacterized protein YjiK
MRHSLQLIQAGGPWIVLALALATLGCRTREAPQAMEAQSTAKHYDLATTPAWQVELPGELTEISGLAVTADGRLFAHGDEDATVFEVEPRTGRIVKRFGLAATGNEPDLGKKQRGGGVNGDFEGITVVGNRFFLVTSNGILLEFPEGAEGEKVEYTAYETGLARHCEVEGLTHDRQGRGLLLLCKEQRQKGERDRVEIHAWSLSDRRLEAEPGITISYSALSAHTGGKAFNGSAVSYAVAGDTLLIVAGPQRLYAEITGAGQVVRAGPLDRNSQSQPEGVAFLGDGTLLISSEGGKGRATLSGYQPR